MLSDISWPQYDLKNILYLNFNSAKQALNPKENVTPQALFFNRDWSSRINLWNRILPSIQQNSTQGLLQLVNQSSHKDVSFFKEFSIKFTSPVKVKPVVSHDKEEKEAAEAVKKSSTSSASNRVMASDSSSNRIIFKNQIKEEIDSKETFFNLFRITVTSVALFIIINVVLITLIIVFVAKIKRSNNQRKEQDIKHEEQETDHHQGRKRSSSTQEEGVQAMFSCTSTANTVSSQEVLVDGSHFIPASFTPSSFAQNPYPKHLLQEDLSCASPLSSIHSMSFSSPTGMMSTRKRKKRVNFNDESLLKSRIQEDLDAGMSQEMKMTNNEDIDQLFPPSVTSLSSCYSPGCDNLLADISVCPVSGHDNQHQLLFDPENPYITFCSCSLVQQQDLMEDQLHIEMHP